MRYLKIAAAIGVMLAAAGLSGCHAHHGHGYGSRSNYYYQDRSKHDYDRGYKYRRHGRHYDRDFYYK